MSVAENLNMVRERIQQAASNCNRDGESVNLIAISKFVPAGEVFEAITAGQKLFGENYVQEGKRKIAELATAARFSGLSFVDPPVFHLTGPLQRNKVKHAVGLFELIHSVDRLELAEEISKEAGKRGVVQRILVQVNVSGEESKSGIAPAKLVDLYRDVSKMPGVKLDGLMCIGRIVPEEAPADERKSEFVMMRELKEGLEKEGLGVAHLSMGMSHDFELAIAEGATYVRVGSAIFGERTK